MKKKDWFIGICVGLLLSIVFLRTQVFNEIAVADELIPTQIEASEGLTSGKIPIKSIGESDTSDFSLALRELMLKSDLLWTSIHLEGTTVWYQDGKPDSQWVSTLDVWQGEYARLDIAKLGQPVSFTWILNPDGVFNIDHIEQSITRSDLPNLTMMSQLVPKTLAEINTMELNGFPIEGMIPSEFASFIYPHGLAQRGTPFRLLEETTYLDTAIWVVEWQHPSGSPRYQYQIDQNTGLLFGAVGYAGIDGQLLNEESIITQIDFSPTFSEEHFQVEGGTK